MSVIWGNSESIYSVSVLRLVTYFRPSDERTAQPIETSELDHRPKRFAPQNFQASECAGAADRGAEEEALP